MPPSRREESCPRTGRSAGVVSRWVYPYRCGSCRRKFRSPMRVARHWRRFPGHLKELLED